jgi:sterol desaturase/sphingolipid hydroxylase (fatty acid hydroxylase superfamily)
MSLGIEMLYDSIESLRTSDLWQPVLWVTLVNVAMFVIALSIGEALLRRFADRRITPDPGPITGKEKVLAAVCVGLNAMVAVAGLVLWREGVIDLRPYGDYSAGTVLIDALVLFFAMDILMYVFHRVAHHPLLFAFAHRTHHDYESPRPLTLFVLNPMEVLGFGAIWLLVLLASTASIEGILVYLGFNLAFGLVAHVGVEPAPRQWLRVPLLRYIATSTFHAEHHLDRSHNYGFYLVIWDRLLGTISPTYAADFVRITASPVVT